MRKPHLGRARTAIKDPKSGSDYRSLFAGNNYHLQAVRADNDFALSDGNAINMADQLQCPFELVPSTPFGEGRHHPQSRSA